jgi:hypothetical protein
LNVAEYVNLAKQAAENTESLAFNTDDYAFRLGKAARNARLLGSTDRESSKYAAGKMELLDRKNAYMDMRQGQGIVKSLNKAYAQEINSKDFDAIVEGLQKNQGITNVDQAMQIASTLINQKNIPNIANMMADLTRGSKLQRDVMTEEINKVITNANVTSKADIMKVVFNPLVAGSLGFDPNDAKSRDMLFGLVKEVMMEKGIMAPSKEVAPTWDGVKAMGDVTTQQQAVTTTSIEQTKENSNVGLKKYWAHFQALLNNPIIGPGALLAGSAAAGFGLPRIARYLRGAAPVTADTGPGLLSRLGTSARHAGSAVLSGVKKHKYIAATLAALGLGFGAYKKFGSDDEETSMLPANINPVESLDSNTEATRANTAAMIKAQNDAVAEVPKSTSNVAGSPDEYSQTIGENVGYGVVNAVTGFIASKGIDKIVSRIPQLANSAVTTAAQNPLTRWTMRGIPVLGSVASSAMTYGITEGSKNRKLAAAGGDFAGSMLGMIPALGGGKLNFAWSAVGEAIATSMYDYNTEARKSEIANMADAFNKVASVSDRAYSQPLNTSRQAGFAQQDLDVLPTSIGNFGPTRPDGSVDVVINARVGGFATAVNQANTSNFARSTQLSGAQR